MKHKRCRYACIGLLLMFTSCNFLDIGGKDEKVAGGEVVWSVDNQEILTVSTQPAISKGRVYFIQDAKLKAYTLTEGNKIWSTQICQQGRTCDYSRKILQTEDRIFIDQGFNIQAHFKATGSIIWETTITGDAGEVSGLGSPIMSQDHTYLYAGRKGYVVKVRKSDGKLVQTYPLDKLVPKGVIQGSTEPIISPFGDNILYAPASYYDRTTPGEEEFGANLFAFDTNTNELIWTTPIIFAIDDTRTEMPGDSVDVSPPIYDIALTDSSIVALQGRAIIVVDRLTGKIRWYRNFPHDGFDVGLDVKDTGIYAVSLGGGPGYEANAYRINLKTGKTVWRQSVNYSNTSIPTVQNGRLYFNNSGGGGIWVLDITDGSVIYNQPPPNHKNDDFDVYISSLGVGEGYMVNVGSKAVYCLKVP